MAGAFDCVPEGTIVPGVPGRHAVKGGAVGVVKQGDLKPTPGVYLHWSV